MIKQAYTTRIVQIKQFTIEFTAQSDKWSDFSDKSAVVYSST